LLKQNNKRTKTSAARSKINEASIIHYRTIGNLLKLGSLILALMLVGFKTYAKEAWVDKSVDFAETLKFSNEMSTSRSIHDLEQELSNLSSTKRLRAYQQVSFMYLVDWRVEEYRDLKEIYSPLLSQHQQDNYLDMQLVLDILEAYTSPQELDEVIVTVESLIKSRILSDEAHVLAHVVHVYARNLKRITPLTLKAISDARNAYIRSDKTAFAGVALELASAYTMMNVQDFAQSNESYRAAYEYLQNYSYLSFNVNNYLSNLSYMFRQIDEVKHAIDINNWQLANLSDESAKSYVFFVYFACGVYQQLNGNLERSLSCLFSAEDYVEHVPGRRESWYTAIITSSVLAQKIEIAKQYFSRFTSDPHFTTELSPLSKMHLAKAYLDIKNGESNRAIATLNEYHVSNSNRQIDRFRKLSIQYSSFIDNEVAALEKNVSLQKQLLDKQKILNIAGISIIAVLAVFAVSLSKSRKKQYMLATHDSLTGLYNRHGFLEAFPILLDKIERNESTLALGTMDIDGFKAINDVYGHAAGDEVLKVIALRLKKLLGEEAVVGRMGGDEFSFVIPNITNEQALISKNSALCESLNKTIEFLNFSLKPSVSIGVASYPNVADTIDQLIDCSEFALNACKTFERGSARLFGVSDQSTMDTRRKIESALATASDDEFCVYYQAIVDAQTSKVKGFEALARWQSPKLGFVSPADFIPIAEQTGYINKLSRLLLSKALEEASKWPENITLSFNLSSQDVNSIENAQKIKNIMLDSRFPKERIIAEMTETAIVQDTNTTREALRLLTEMGVSIALDDFGTGYSSINHLLDFEFSRIKLDRVLIDSIETDQNKYEIVHTLINLCHNLKIDSVIEGIETESQSKILRKMQVKHFQGYLYSKPIPPDEIPAILSKYI
jgi:diguanylate cyclase (GGDEF)-like protein